MSESHRPEFYYSQSGAEVIGPITAPALLDLLSANEVDSQTLVTAEGMKSWITLAELMNSHLFKAATQNGEIPKDVAPPTRNPTLALGTFALLFTNPFTIGLAALGIPAYYLTRSKKRPPESILSALKPDKQRENEFLDNKLLPESGTTGPKAVISFAGDCIQALGEACSDYSERERIAKLKELRRQEACSRLLRMPPQTVIGWLFYGIILCAVLAGLYFTVIVQEGDAKVSFSTMINTVAKQSGVSSFTNDEHSQSEQHFPKSFPSEARLLREYSIPLENGILGIRSGTKIDIIGKTPEGWSATFAGEQFIVREGDCVFQKE